MDAPDTIPRRRITDRVAPPGRWGYVETPEEIRVRALRFIGLTALIEGVLILTRWVLLPGLTEMTERPPTVALGGSVALELAWAGVYAAAAGFVLLGRPTAFWTIRATLILVASSAAIAIVRRSVGIDPGPGGHALATMLIAHTAGALMLPWSPRQALMLAVGWVAVSGASLVWLEPAGPTSRWAEMFATVSVTVPGTMIAFFRSTRIRDRFTVRVLEDRFARVREELSAARHIHEGAFPRPRYSGLVRFAYEYRPMSQIGGDYLFACADRASDPNSPVTLVLLDVTGHGIPAALTVNRLQGELARLVAEHPGLGAGALLELLNRYVYLTMGEQSVFVTAVALRADPGAVGAADRPGTVELANAGHPPVLVRRANGAIETMGATATVLGAQEPDDYRARAVTMPFGPGDSVIAFTDGVTEARGSDGRMFGVEGVRALVEAGRIDPARRWPELLAKAVEKHQPGNPTDDTLIVELFRTGDSR
jgi:serine phosphatase RsbU (regulator of sigma subunit)